MSTIEFVTAPLWGWYLAGCVVAWIIVRSFHDGPIFGTEYAIAVVGWPAVVWFAIVYWLFFQHDPDKDQWGF
jgi:hypothetical protein